MEYLPPGVFGFYPPRHQSGSLLCLDRRTFPRCRRSGDAGHLQKTRDSARAQAATSMPDMIQSGVGPEIIYSRGVSFPSCYSEDGKMSGGFQNTASPSHVPPWNRERGATEMLLNLVGPELLAASRHHHRRSCPTGTLGLWGIW